MCSSLSNGILCQKYLPQVRSKKWKKQHILTIFVLVIWALLFGLLFGLGWDSDQIENEIGTKTLVYFSEPIGNQ